MRLMAYSAIAVAAALGAAALALLAADRFPAHAQMSLGLGLGIPESAPAAGGQAGLPDPAVVLNFAAGTYSNSAAPGCVSAATCVTTTNSGGLAVDSGGVWHSFGANTPRVTDLGLTVEESRTNLFLNSQAPTTQTITVVSTSVYTVSVYGTASVVLSGAGTGTVTQGSPITFTASTTSLICTVSGAGGTFQNVQVELGSFATTPILTAGASVTRSADRVPLTTAPAFGTGYSILAAGVPESPVSNTANQVIVEASDGTTNNRLAMSRASGNAFPGVGSTSAGTATNFQAPVTWNNSSKAAASDTAGNQILAFNGGNVFTGAGALPVGVNQLAIGTRAAGNLSWNGTITQIQLWPTTALTAAQLQEITR